MKRTRSKVKTVTNLQLAIAIGAVFLAGGLALAALPQANIQRDTQLNKVQDCNDVREVGAKVDYLIVTTKRFCEAAKKLQNFRNARGHRVAIVTIDSTPLVNSFTAENIDAQIEAYAEQRKKLQYILLLGDLDTIPSFHFVSNFYPEHPNYISDYNYSVVGDQRGAYLPTFMVGRLPIKNNSEIDPYLTKVNFFENKRTKRNDVLFFGFSPEITNYIDAHDAAVTQQGFNTFTQIDPHDYNAFYDFLNGHKSISYMVYYSHGSWYGNGPINVDDLRQWQNPKDPVVYLSGGCGFSGENSPQRSFSEIMQFRDNGAVAAIGPTEDGGFGYDYELPPLFFTSIKTSNTLGQAFKNSIISYNNMAVASGRNTTSLDEFDSYFMHRLVLVGDPALRTNGR